MAVEPAAVLGRAVGDVIHLLAELIENATSFSPPHTRVQVTGQVVPNGYAVEIEDRGLGMTPEAIDEANRRLADPPDFDPANSARLGLFVVAQLAAPARHPCPLRPLAVRRGDRGRAGARRRWSLAGAGALRARRPASRPTGRCGAEPAAIPAPATADGPRGRAVLRGLGAEDARPVRLRCGR